MTSCLFKCRVGIACKGKTLVVGCMSKTQDVCAACERSGYEMPEKPNHEPILIGLLSVMAH